MPNAEPTIEPLDEPAPAPESEPEAAPAPTAALAAVERELVVYDDDFGTSIAPIFADHCASCHNAAGPGAPHWQLENAGDLVATHEWIASVINTGYMPPWPAGDLSPLFHEDRSLGDDEIAAVAAWSADGAPLDVEPTMPIVAPAGVVVLDADVEIAPHESYQGSPTVADDYRCFIYELGVTEPTFMSGYEFVPDQTQIVHHAVGFLLPAAAMDQAMRLSDRDDRGGWQCYGTSGLRDESLFVGWAPGQLPTIYPEGSGLLVQPGDFVVLQLHYHFDTEAPEDRSTLLVDWADGERDEIEIGQFLAPAEIPCASDESGPLCDRDAARSRALSRFGSQGVLADRINSVCGVRPADFEDMTDGIATSSCILPVLQSGEVIAVFGHQHEIGKSIRMTLNPGGPEERILLDVPDWNFDWQFNYEPVESIMVEFGDSLLLECAWDRDRRDPSLEPAWVLWADGTDDEMCFATMATRPIDDSGSPAPAADGITPDDVQIPLSPELAECLNVPGVTGASLPQRDEIDEAVQELFACATPEEIGELLSSSLADTFGGLLSDEHIDCLAENMATPEGATDLFTFSLLEATRIERQPFAEVIGDCVGLAEVISNFGFPIPDEATSCIDEQGRSLLVTSLLVGEVPDELALFALVNGCINDG